MHQFEKRQKSTINLGTKLTKSEIWQLVYDIAWNGVGKVKSNPLVGAVLTSANGVLLGAAYHERYGWPHAERALLVPLLEKFGKDFFRGTILYISLEPCNHYGKTPPCTELIRTLPISKVIYAESDPNPQVKGRGAAYLKACGFCCEHEDTQMPFENLTEMFKKIALTDLPFVGLKMAIASDGTYGKKDETKFWLTCKKSVQYAHFLRKLYDAVLIGANTLMVDDPLLNVRYFAEDGVNPKRIVLDLNGRAIESCGTRLPRILQSEERSNVVWIISEEKFSEHKTFLSKFGVKTVVADRSANLHDILLDIRRLDIASVLIEGGAATWESFLTADLVDKHHIFVTPATFSGGNYLRIPEDFFSLQKMQNPLSLGVDKIYEFR